MASALKKSVIEFIGELKLMIPIDSDLIFAEMYITKIEESQLVDNLADLLFRHKLAIIRKNADPIFESLKPLGEKVVSRYHKVWNENFTKDDQEMVFKWLSYFIKKVEELI